MNDEKSYGYNISTDKKLLDVPLIHQFLSNRSYWAQNIPIAIVQKSIDNALCFGVYNTLQEQVAFARLVTDYATFAYLADVFVIETERNKGISKLLMQHIIAYPDLQNIRRILLVTRDAHSLYAQFGFKTVENPQNIMTIHKPDVYSGN